MFQIVLTWPATAEELQVYRAHVGGDAEVTAPRSSSPEDLMAAARQAHALVGRYVPAVMIDNAPDLRLVQILHAGVHASQPNDEAYGFSFSQLRERGITMCSTHSHRVAVAEHAFALMLAQAKNLLASHAAVSQGAWYPFDERHWNTRLDHSSLVLIGYGNIGREIAKRALSFEMKVTAVKHSAGADSDGEVRLLPSNRIEEALPQADFVIICCPLTDSTKGMLNARLLNLMKPTAYLINVARAAIVDEADLADALGKGTIAGYASDVWWLPTYQSASGNGRLGYHYPVPSQHQINRHERVIATGDRASWTKETRVEKILGGIDNARRIARGEAPENAVPI